MGFKGVEKSRRSPDAISPEGTGQSVARHGSAGKDFTQIESRRDDTMGSSHANSLPKSLCTRIQTKTTIQSNFSYSSGDIPPPRKSGERSASVRQKRSAAHRPQA